MTVILARAGIDSYRRYTNIGGQQPSSALLLVEILHLLMSTGVLHNNLYFFQQDALYIKTPYRSCAALLDISNPSKYLIEFSLVWLVLVWFGWYGLVAFCFVWLVLV